MPGSMRASRRAERPGPLRAAAAAAAAMAALALLAAGCGGTGPAEPTGGGAAAAAVPELAENRVQPLETRHEPRLPVTVSSVVNEEFRTAETVDRYQDVEVADISRIVPLTGSIAEIVYTLGFGENVVARDASATFEQIAGLPSVTEGHAVRAESVLSQRPTLIIADTWNQPYEAIEQLRASGVPVVILEEAWTFEDMTARIGRVAEVLGVPEAGAELVRRTEDQLDQVRSELPADRPELTVAFLYLRGSAGVYLLGGRGSGADTLVEEVGATDAGVALGLDQPFTPITTEALIGAQPDVILVMTGGLESVGGVDGLVQIPGVAQTPAGRDRRVIDFEDGVLLSYGPRTPQVLAELADRLYGGTAASPS